MRANLWQDIVLKTPFSRSFMEMSFPSWKGSLPVLNIEKSLHKLTKVIPDPWTRTPGGAGNRCGGDIHSEKKNGSGAGTHPPAVHLKL